MPQHAYGITSRVISLSRLTPAYTLSIIMTAQFFVFGQSHAQPVPAPLQSCEDLTADWPLWSTLSKHPWSKQEIAEQRFFPLDLVKKALAIAPLSTTPISGYENYADEYPDRPGVADYRVAAAAYHSRNLGLSVKLFDKIIADENSGYRAAAAYSAARAEFESGHLAGGAERIDRLVRDSSLSEFEWPAYDLISKMRYQSNEVAWDVGELAEISHMLVAPTAAVCGSPIGEQIRRKFDWEWSLFTWVDYGDEKWPYFQASVRNIAATSVAKDDAVIDAAGSLGAYTDRSSFYYPGADYKPLPVQRKLLDHAKENWAKSHNPLWAVAIAEHTNSPDDAGIMIAALPVLRDWPNLRKSAQAKYAWRLVAQIVRLHLTAGNIDAAITDADLLTPEERAFASEPNIQPDISTASEIILGNALRWLIKKNDYESARHWALEGSKAFGIVIPNELKVALAENWDELFGQSALALDRNDGVVELGNARALLDIFSSRQLIDFSRKYPLSKDDRRAIVGAAWVRAYALEHWRDLEAWLPDLKSAFPELKEDADAIQSAWFQSTKRHRALLLVLRTPGLVSLPSWARPPGGPRNFTTMGIPRETDVQKFDDQNPNDGNWWCSPDQEVIQVDTASALVGMTTESYWFLSDFMSFRYASDYPNKRAAVLSQTHPIMAAFPLLKIADVTELKAFGNTGSASKRLSEDAVKWAESINWLDRVFGWDFGVPDALAKAVKSTRYGCRRPPENGPWSREAYLTLHRLYPKTDWALKTKYWFNTIVPN